MHWNDWKRCRIDVEVPYFVATVHVSAQRPKRPHLKHGLRRGARPIEALHRERRLCCKMMLFFFVKLVHILKGPFPREETALDPGSYGFCKFKKMVIRDNLALQSCFLECPIRVTVSTLCILSQHSTGRRSVNPHCELYYHHVLRRRMPLVVTRLWLPPGNAKISILKRKKKILKKTHSVSGDVRVGNHNIARSLSHWHVWAHETKSFIEGEENFPRSHKRLHDKGEHCK